MIRRAQMVDYPIVKDCAKAAFEPYVERIGREPAPMQANFVLHIQNDQLYVLEHQHAVVAYVVFYLQGDYILLENIAVHPTYSGRGFGKQLIQFVEQTATSWKVPIISLYTNAMMVESIALYESLGLDYS